MGSYTLGIFFTLFTTICAPQRKHSPKASFHMKRQVPATAYLPVTNGVVHCRESKIVVLVAFSVASSVREGSTNAGVSVRGR